MPYSPVTRTVITLLALSALTTAGARAEDCGDTAPRTVEELQQAVAAGSRLASELERTGARLAIVARVGSDQRRRGIRYTHAGLSLRDHPNGRWHFVHALNICAGGRSDLFDDGPVDFFLERPFAYDAWVVVPEPALQEALIALLDAGVDRRVHEPRYNAIAHPASLRDQNSNQWLLELIALALDPRGSRDRAFAQLTLERLGYRPARVKLGFFGRVGARRMKNASLRNHKFHALRAARYPYVSVGSIVRFLEQLDAVHDSFEIDHATGHRRAALDVR